MSMTITPQAPWIHSDTPRRTALGLEFTLDGAKGSWEPELSEEEQAVAQAQPLVSRRQLTDEEQARLEELQDQLEGLLQELAENPSDDKRARIREIESEMEEITGVKVTSRLTKMVANVPGKNDEEDEDQVSTLLQMVGSPTALLAEKLAARTLPESDDSPQPGIPGPGLLSQVLQAAGAYNSMSKLGASPLRGNALNTVI